MNEKPLVISCYTNPDIDGFACGVAYSELLNKAGRPARFFYSGILHDEVVFVLHAYAFSVPQLSGPPSPEEGVVLVDASTVTGIVSGINLDKVVEVIDHRKINDAEKFPYATIQIEMVGSCATLITEKYISSGVEISSMAATLLYAAIISNTLNFMAAVTTGRDTKAAVWLTSQIHPSEDFVEQLFIAKSDLRGDKLLSRMEGEFASFNLFGKQIGIIQIEIINAKDLIDERRLEIENVLQQAVTETGVEDCFVSFIDLNKNRNFFIATNHVVQKMLGAVLGVQFHGTLAERPGFIMRKEIVPKLKESLEHANT
jgi:manganese-dependent inorganic pyrophosphatase